MIINFSIRNFKVIKEKITLSFEATSSDHLAEYYIESPFKNLRVLRLALIYGPNASGKTTILEALNFLRNLVIKPLPDKSSSFTDLKPFLGDKNFKKQNTSFELEFVTKGTKYLYEVELNQKAIIKESLYRFKPKKALVYYRTTNLEKELTEIKFGSKIKLDKASRTSLIYNTLWNNTVVGGYLKTNLSVEEFQEVVDWFKNKLKLVIVPEVLLFPFISDKLEQGQINKKRIIKLLKKADLGIDDIFIKEKQKNGEIFNNVLDFLKNFLQDDEISKIKENQRKMIVKELLFKHSINNQEFVLPFEEESAGTRRYYEMCGILDMMLNNEIIVPIDELESSLHPDLINHFLLTFLINVKNSQLIATTHYRELLLEKDILRNDVIWFTERKDDGSADLYSLADFDTSTIRKTSSIYNAYKIGKLGAVPNLDDPYLNIEDEKKEEN
jgi:AAA15 family ATPase/GTPase